MEKLQPALNARDVVGESILWDDRSDCLVWVDIIGRRVHRWAPESGRHQVDEMPDFVTCIGMRKAGGYVVGLTKRVMVWDGAGGLQPLAEIEPDLPGNRLNESKMLGCLVTPVTRDNCVIRVNQDWNDKSELFDRHCDTSNVLGRVVSRVVRIREQRLERPLRNLAGQPDYGFAIVGVRRVLSGRHDRLQSVQRGALLR